MTLVTIDVSDVASETHPDDRVVFWAPQHRPGTHTAKHQVPLVNGVGEEELKPGPTMVQFHCRGIADTAPKLGTVPESGTVTLDDVLDDAWEYSPEVVRAAQQARDAAIDARDEATRQAGIAQEGADRVGTAEQVGEWADSASADAGRAKDEADRAKRNADSVDPQNILNSAKTYTDTEIAAASVGPTYQVDDPGDTGNMFEQDHYGQGYAIDVQNMPGSNSALVIHNYTDEEAVIIDNCDNEAAVEINNTINLNITPDNVAQGDFLHFAPWDNDWRKRWYLSLQDDLTWRNDTAHPISIQRVNDVTPHMRPQDDIAFQVKNESGSVTARVHSDGRIESRGMVSKRHIIMTADSGSTELSGVVEDDGTIYQTAAREIRFTKPVLLTLVWEGDGEINLRTWNHQGGILGSIGTLPGGGQSWAAIRLEPPAGANATFVPDLDANTTGKLHVYAEVTT